MALYRKQEVLGWGSFATVSKGWDELLDRPVAIKELVPPFSGNDPFVRAYFAHALRMVDVSHRNVLATYGIEPGRTPPALTRELADETLGHQLIEGAVAPDAVLRILRHVLNGLIAIHEREMLHRAVKPENIFVCGQVYKIGDFGLPPVDGSPSCPLRRLKYTAPESLESQEETGPSSDLYSLGLVLHELLLGPIRFEKIVEEVLAKSLPPRAREEDEDDREGIDHLWPLFHAAPEALPAVHEVEPSIPVAFSLILQRMVRKVPAERYSSCREVLTALGTAGLVETLGGTVSLMVAPTDSRREQSGRNSIWIGGGTLAALILAGTALVLGLHDRRGDVTTAEPDSTFQSSPSSSGEITNAQGLADRLSGLLSSAPDFRLDLDPPAGGDVARRPIGSPLRFQVTSDRSAYLALLVLSSDGSLTCLYPSPNRKALRIQQGQSLLLPSPDDERAGFELYAQEPAGRDRVFLLASKTPLPALPSGVSSSPWLTEYPLSPGASDNPALRFVEWLDRLHREDAGLQLLVREIEITGAQ